MFTAEERVAIREDLLDFAKADPRISGVALTGSASIDAEDDWSDIDLAFGITSDWDEVIQQFTDHLVSMHGAVDTLDVPSGPWLYRVFLLRSSLQVDLAFAPTPDFAARASTFKLLHGEASAPETKVTDGLELHFVRWAWLYALHVRSALSRGRLWQAEHMLHGMREQVISLACLSHALPWNEGRGVDGLPGSFLERLMKCRCSELSEETIRTAFIATADLLRTAIAECRPALSPTLCPVLEHILETTCPPNVTAL